MDDFRIEGPAGIAPVQTPAEALDVGRWYECRWIIEEYHKAMKTGCRVENPQFQSEERLQPMIALLSVVPVAGLLFEPLWRQRKTVGAIVDD